MASGAFKNTGFAPAAGRISFAPEMTAPEQVATIQLAPEMADPDPMANVIQFAPEMTAPDQQSNFIVDKPLTEEIGVGSAAVLGATEAFDPLSRYLIKKLHDPYPGETEEQKNARLDSTISASFEARKKEHPVAFRVGSFGTDVITLGFASKIAGGLLKAFGVGSKILKTASLPQKFVKGAAMGAVYGAGAEATKEVINEGDINIGRVAVRSAQDALLFGTFDAGLSVIGGKLKGAFWGKEPAVLTAEEAVKVKPVIDKIMKSSETIAEDVGNAIKKMTQRKGVGDITIAEDKLMQGILNNPYVKSAVEGLKAKMVLNTATTTDKIVSEIPHAMPGFNLNETYVGAINKTKYFSNLKGEQKEKMTEALENNVFKASQKIAENKGEKLTHEEIRDFSAKADPAVLMEQLGEFSKLGQRDQTLLASASIYHGREQLNNLVRLQEMLGKWQIKNPDLEKAVSDGVFDLSVKLSDAATFSGRLLNSFKLRVGNISRFDVQGLISTVNSAAKKIGIDTDTLMREWLAVDKSDMRSITAFYRKYVNPIRDIRRDLGKLWQGEAIDKQEFRHNVWDVLSTYRYINMLSSTKTQIVNTASNTIQGVFMPVTKGIDAALDVATSTIRNTDRQRFFRELPLYYRGFFGNIFPALQDALKAVQGKAIPTMLDVNRIPLFAPKTTAGQVAQGVLSAPVRFMEAADIFMRGLIQGGEKEARMFVEKKLKGAVTPEAEAAIEEKAYAIGMYKVFRQGLFPEGQGDVLNKIDEVTDFVLKARENNPELGFIVPFIQTSTNIFKQGLEYSPLGLLVQTGASKEVKQEALSKALLGSMVATGAAWMAITDRTTWKTPDNADRKKLFYQAGMQPFSLKVGNKWVQYQQIGALAYPFAMLAALKDNYMKYGLKDFDGFMNTTIQGGALPMLTMFSNMTYVKGLADFSEAISGRQESAWMKTMMNIPRQFTPYSGMLGWIERWSDKYYRDPKTAYEMLTAQIPILARDVAPYENWYGLPAERGNRTLGAFSPANITQEQPLAKLYGAEQSMDVQMRNLNTEQEKIKRRVLLGMTQK